MKTLATSNVYINEEPFLVKPCEIAEKIDTAVQALRTQGYAILSIKYVSNLSAPGGYIRVGGEKDEK